MITNRPRRFLQLHKVSILDRLLFVNAVVSLDVRVSSVLVPLLGSVKRPTLLLLGPDDERAGTLTLSGSVTGGYWVDASNIGKFQRRCLLSRALLGEKQRFDWTKSVHYN